MCLIAIAHLASERFPLVIAANRDEDYARPTITAAPWTDEPHVIGGRDVLHGGSWLAIHANGRFAAVTNLRGSVPPRDSRSRGFLIRDFVLSNRSAEPFVAEVAAEAHHYAGFHLVVGTIGGEAIHLSRAATVLQPGVHGLSNALPEERWPKVDRAVARVRGALEASSREELAEELLSFLSTPMTTAAIENEVFISSDRYGTRSSTVIVATAGEIAFYEQNFTTGGARFGDLRTFVLHRGGR